MTKLAYLMSKSEGFGPAANLPTRDNNPGDLRHSPHSSHAGEGPNDIGEIDTMADGWADLERQLEIYAKEGLTLRQMIYTYAPPKASDGGNPTAAYLATICAGMGMPPETLVMTALAVDNEIPKA
jgi:hypothetical protein